MCSHSSSGSRRFFPSRAKCSTKGATRYGLSTSGAKAWSSNATNAPICSTGSLYSFFRKNKARRAYEHALRLRGMGFDTPEPVAWSEYRKDGLIADTYFVSRRSELTPLPQTMKQFPAPDTLPVLEAFARFTVRLHEQGICHEDFNQTNILWEYDGTTGSYRFQLIDINRMRFHARPLRPDECMINLRRLSCPAVPFLYILDRYADIRGWDINDTLLRGVFFRLLFGRRQQFKKRFRKRKSAAAGKKQG